MAGRLLTFFEKQYLRSIMFYVIHSFRTRGIWPSIKIWAGEVSYCCRSNDRFWLSRPLFDHPNSTLGEENNPFQASYFSIAKEALSIVRDQEEAVSLCDVGAGNGRVAKIALDLGFLDVWGVEIDERWQEALQTVHEQANGQFNFTIGDALKTMPQRHFDAIFLFNPMSRKVFASLLEGLVQRKFLPRVFVQVNPEYDDMLVEAGYEETHSRSTGKQIEYKIFRRQTP